MEKKGKTNTKTSENQNRKTCKAAYMYRSIRWKKEVGGGGGGVGRERGR